MMQSPKTFSIQGTAPGAQPPRSMLGAESCTGCTVGLQRRSGMGAGGGCDLCRRPGRSGRALGESGSGRELAGGHCASSLQATSWDACRDAQGEERGRLMEACKVAPHHMMWPPALRG